MSQTLEISTVVELTEPQRIAWLTMAQAKNELVSNLTNAELAAQALLLPVQTSENYADIDAALAAYKKAYNEMVEVRKEFTNKIDAGIVQPLMAFEKRVKDNTVQLELTQKSLQLRQQAEQQAKAANAKNSETAAFKTHVTNEFTRLAEDLRSRYRKEITNQYTIHLQQRISPTMDKIIAELLKMLPAAPAKFNAQYLTKEEMSDIYSTIHKVNVQQIQQDAIELLKETFANFDSDLANAAAAIEHQKQQDALAEIESSKKLAEEQAMNTLIIHSEAVAIDAPKIKKTVQVVVVESEQWAKAVMAAFITNLPYLSKYIRTKSWAKLTIGQMAEYLSKFATDEGAIFNGLQMTEVCK
jgi:hypothetical protein